MKKKFLLLGATIVMSALVLTGCGNDNGNGNGNANTSDSEYEFVERTNTFLTSKGRITIRRTRFATPSGRPLIFVDYTVENTTDETLTVADLFSEFILATQDGQTLEWQGARSTEVEARATHDAGMSVLLENDHDPVTFEFYTNIHTGDLIGSFVFDDFPEQETADEEEADEEETTAATDEEAQEESQTARTPETTDYWNASRRTFQNANVQLRMNDTRIADDRDGRPSVSFSMRIENVGDTAKSIDALTNGVVIARQNGEVLDTTNVALRTQNMHFIVEPGANTTVFFNYVLSNESDEVELNFYEGGNHVGTFSYRP